jgi:hypothetical protein
MLHAVKPGDYTHAPCAPFHRSTVKLLLCCTLQIEKARDQGPEAFKQFFQGALASAQVAYAQGQDQPGWHWLMCEACKQWRLVTGALVFFGGGQLGTSHKGRQQTLGKPTGRFEAVQEWVG